MEQLADQPEIQAAVQHEIGLIYHHLGLEVPARRHLGAALDLRRELNGPDHPSVALTLSLLADAQPAGDGRLAAKTMAAEAVSILRRSSTPDDPALVRPLNTLVAILCQRDELDEARALAEEAVVRASGLPASDYRRAFASVNLAVIRSGNGDYADAARLYDDALRMLEAQLGPDHPALTPALINRGVAQRNLGRLAEALSDYERAWTLIEPRGTEHPLVLPVLNNLGRLRFALGDFRGARDDFEQALEALRQRGGNASPLALRLEMRVAEAQNRLGQPREAEVTLRRLLDHWRPKLGQDDPWIHQTRSILGEALRLQGRGEEAEALLRSAFLALRAHRLVRFRREAFDRLAALLEAHGRPEEIAALRSQAH